MRHFNRAVEIVVVFAAVLILATFLAIALSFEWGFVIYLGAILYAWLLIAYVMPMLTGVMAPREILDGVRAQRRYETQLDGELLPNWQDRQLGIPDEQSDTW